MSAAQAGPLKRKEAAPRSLKYYGFFWSFTTAAALLATWHIVHSRVVLTHSVGVIAVWLGALLVLSVVDIRTAQGPALSSEVPLAIAMTILFPPLTVGLVGFLAAFDPREVKRRTTITKALFNRSQVFLGLALASVAAHRVSGSVRGVAGVGVAIVTAFIVWTLVNYIVVAIAQALDHGTPVRNALVSLRIGRTADFAFTMLTWQLIAFLQVVTYRSVGHWTVALFCSLALLARQMLARSDSVLRAEESLLLQRQAIVALNNKGADERREERVRIAARLHDEVSQPLFQVSLLSQVTKRDLAAGRLLDLDEDLPNLMNACDLASDSLRELIRELRTGPAGLGDLTAAINGLVKEARSRGKAKIWEI